MRYAFQTPEKLYLVLDFYQGGELFTHLENSHNFEENQVRFYIAEIIVALEQLHKFNVIYRDLKLENILLDGQGHIILTGGDFFSFLSYIFSERFVYLDFGVSKELKGEARAHSYCGTIDYMVRKRNKNLIVKHFC
jgi:ribosomal protein S6 kinase alpha-5